MPGTLEGRWFTFTARGHVNVRAKHRTTLEVTREDWLTPRGDCILGVSSEVGAAGLPGWIREAARDPGSVIVMVLCSGGVCDSVAGRGDPRITLDDPDRIVVRRSTYVDGKTLMVEASKAAAHVRRDLVEHLRRGEPLLVALTVLPGLLKRPAGGGAPDPGPGV